MDRHFTQEVSEMAPHFSFSCFKWQLSLAAQLLNIPSKSLHFPYPFCFSLFSSSKELFKYIERQKRKEKRNQPFWMLTQICGVNWENVENVKDYGSVFGFVFVGLFFCNGFCNLWSQSHNHQWPKKDFDFWFYSLPKKHSSGSNTSNVNHGFVSISLSNHFLFLVFFFLSFGSYRCGQTLFRRLKMEGWMLLRHMCSGMAMNLLLVR